MRSRGKRRSDRCDLFFLRWSTVSAMSEIGNIVYTHRRKLYGFPNLFVGILWSSKCAKCRDEYLRQYVEAVIHYFTTSGAQK